jgi:hypothetical protein
LFLCASVQDGFVFDLQSIKTNVQEVDISKKGGEKIPFGYFSLSQSPFSTENQMPLLPHNSNTPIF